MLFALGIRVQLNQLLHPNNISSEIDSIDLIKHVFDLTLSQRRGGSITDRSFIIVFI